MRQVGKVMVLGFGWFLDSFEGRGERGEKWGLNLFKKKTRLGFKVEFA